MQSFLGTGTLLAGEPAAAKNRPIGMMLPETVRIIDSLAQGRPGQFSKLSTMQARTIGELGQYGELTMISLVEIVGNDNEYIAQLSGRPKARIERTVALLAEANVIHRGKTCSSHDWVYDRGATGSDIYEKISAEIAYAGRIDHIAALPPILQSLAPLQQFGLRLTGQI